MRIVLAVVGALLFLGATGLGLFLLFESKISGAEFVAFVIAFAIFGAILGFAPAVQEFSIAGNVVKLREIKREVEVAVEGLIKTRTELLRNSLKAGKRDSFVDANGIVTYNFEFWSIVKLATEFDSLGDLKPDLWHAWNMLKFMHIFACNFPCEEGNGEYYVKMSIPDFVDYIKRPEILESIKVRTRLDWGDKWKDRLNMELAELDRLEKLRIILTKI